MTEKIDTALVKKVAHLARLQLDESEIEEFTGQIESIIEYVDTMNRVDTDGIEPLAHCLPVHNRFRPDEVTASLDTDRALQNAPARAGDCFRVPKILDETPGA